MAPVSKGLPGPSLANGEGSPVSASGHVTSRRAKFCVPSFWGVHSSQWLFHTRPARHRPTPPLDRVIYHLRCKHRVLADTFQCLDDTSLFPTSAVTMEFWDDKAEPSILLAVKSACEAVRGNLVNGSSDSR